MRTRIIYQLAYKLVDPNWYIFLRFFGGPADAVVDRVSQLGYHVGNADSSTDGQS
jgi:hypothetical protein